MNTIIINNIEYIIIKYVRFLTQNFWQFFLFVCSIKCSAGGQPAGDALYAADKQKI